MHPAFRRWPPNGQRAALAALALATAFLLATLGLVTRPAGSLAVLWPANAMLAGLLLRHPALGQPLAWGGLLCGMALANIQWGEAPSLALTHGLVDLSGTLVAWRILAPFPVPEGSHGPWAIAHILLAGAAAAATNAAVAITLLHPDNSWGLTAANWFFGQLLSYSAFLPPILLFPRRKAAGKAGAVDRRLALAALRQKARAGWLPIAALAASLALCFLIGGPGAVIFPLPALLYCALVHRPCATAWLASATAVIVTLGIAFGWIPPGAGAMLSGDARWSLASLRLGVLLLVAAPLLTSGIVAARGDTIAALRQALDHDALTQALSRQAFLRDAREHLQRPPGAAPKGHGLLMLDIDDFKRVNDTHGHSAGDHALREFARIIREAVRPHDLFGRMGGEEFGLLLPDATLEDTLEIAERLRAHVEAAEIPLDGGRPLRITVSIGSIHGSQAPFASLAALLAYADHAMYQAKRAGGNRTSSHGAGFEPPPGPLPSPPRTPASPSPKDTREAP